VTKRYKIWYIIGIFIFQYLVLLYGFFWLTVFEVNGSQSVGGKLQIVFELQAVLIEFYGLGLFAKPLIAIAEGIKGHCVIRPAKIDRIQLFDSLIQSVIVHTNSGHSQAPINAGRIFKQVHP